MYNIYIICCCRELHPRTIQRFMPKIISSLEDLNPQTIMSCKVCFCIIVVGLVFKSFLFLCQLLSAHYEHFSRYYQSIGSLDKTSLGLPTEEEKISSAIFLYRLFHCLHKKGLKNVRAVMPTSSYIIACDVCNYSLIILTQLNYLNLK